MKTSFALLAVISAVCSFHGVHILGANVDTYRYTRTLDGGTKVRQWAASIDSVPRVFLKTSVYWLNGQHLKSSQTLIDFSTDPPVSVMKIHGVCVLLPCEVADGGSMTYADAVAKLQNRNGQTVTDALNEEYLDATVEGARLNRTERSDLFASNPSVKKLCNPYYTPIYEPTTSTEASSEPGDCEKRVSSVTLDDLERITLPVTYGYGCGYHHYG